MTIGIGLIIVGIALFISAFAYNIGAWAVIVGIIVAYIGLSIIISKSHNKKIKALDEAVARVIKEQNLGHAERYIDIKSRLVVLDEPKRQIWVFDLNDDTQYRLLKRYSYEDIMAVETIIDGETITKTMRGSQIAGTVIGGAIAGGVGAIIGGLSGKTKEKQKVQKVYLKVHVNQTSPPMFSVWFLDEFTPKEEKLARVASAKTLVQQYNSIFSSIIKDTDRRIAQAAQQSVRQQNVSKSKNLIANRFKKETELISDVAEEIRKMHELFKEGILTEAEFNERKKKLLER